MCGKEVTSVTVSKQSKEDVRCPELHSDLCLTAALMRVNAWSAVTVRNPGAIRPWQFVMDPLNGYLTLIEHLWDDGPTFAGAWNFGPDDRDSREVGFVVDALAQGWGSTEAWQNDDSARPHEAYTLKLDSSKARSSLNWSPRLDLTTSLSWIVAWYREYFANNEARNLTLSQIRQFQELAAQ